MAEPAVRDPDASAPQRLRWGAGEVAYVSGFLALVPALLLVGVATAIDAVQGLFVPTLVGGVAALSAGALLQRGLRDPALTRHELVVPVEADRKLSEELRRLLEDQERLADRLLQVAVRLEELQDEQALSEVVLAARRVAHRSALDLHDTVPELATLLHDDGAVRRDRVTARHQEVARAVGEVEHLLALVGADQRDEALAELRSLTAWVEQRRAALAELDTLDGASSAAGETARG